MTTHSQLARVVDLAAARRVRELRDELRTLRDGEASFFEDFMPALRELLATEVVCAYGLRQAAAGSHELAFHHFVGGIPAREFRSLFSEFLGQNDSVKWGAYNAGRPEPGQRNRVVSLSSRTMLEDLRLPIVTDLFPKVGVGGKTQIRVLLCDGPSLLGWVGAWQDGDCSVPQRAILGALVPALRWRLATERKLAQGSRLAAFDAILDALGQAAFVVDSHGRVREANRIGREMLAAQGRTVRSELADVVRDSRSRVQPRWSATPVATGSSVDFLVLERIEPAARLRARIGRAALRWELTARQREILERLAEGNANRTIAAMLGIAERTVEVHVTALLDKAQVECRAELIAKLHALE